jgi:hypothetical protein
VALYAKQSDNTDISYFVFVATMVAVATAEDVNGVKVKMIKTLPHYTIAYSFEHSVHGLGPES